MSSVKTDSTDEKTLLKGLAQNDRKSVETIYKQYYNMVQSLIINNNGSSDDARDIFQETVIVLYEKARSGTFELNCQLKTYVYSTIYVYLTVCLFNCIFNESFVNCMFN